MNILDLAIGLLALLAAGRGVRAGLFRQVGSLAGFAGGLYAGSFLVPLFISPAGTASNRWLLTMAVLLGMGFLFSAVGESLGYALARIARRIRLGWLDAFLGALLGGLFTLFAVWLLAPLLAGFPSRPLRELIAQSQVIKALSRSLPPQPAVISRLEATLHFQGFPHVFIGLEPVPADPVPAPVPASLASVVAADRQGVVQVEGEACGSLDFGSGFVADTNLVVTNAHVVAGSSATRILSNGSWYAARPVLFDPDLDIALLRTSGLPAAPLPIASGLQKRGTAGAALGFPGGGPFAAIPAGILQNLTAVGRTIYGEGEVERSIYELQAAVEQGNSGGPLVLLDGRVAGVVFARSSTNGGIGYALTIDQVEKEIGQGKAATAAVSTGACMAE